MAEKPTYEELEQRLKELEKIVFKCKQAEEGLRESEERFKAQYQNSPSPTFTWKKQGEDFVLIDFNDAARAITDGKVGEFVGRKATELYLGRQELLRDLRRCCDQREVIIRETMSDHFVPGRLMVVTFGFVPPDLVLVHLEDITDRRQAEKEKDKLQAQLANALEMAHLGHWEYDVANDLFTFNDHFYKIFRTTAKQIGGYTMSSAEYARRFVHPDDMTVVEEENRKAIEAADPHFSRQLEHRMLYADGTVGHISVRFFIVKDAHGRTVKTYGVNQDITERKRAEKELRDSEERYRLHFENVLDVIYTIDLEFKMLDVSPSVEKLLGYKPKELIGRPFQDLNLLAPEYLEQAFSDSIRILKGERIISTVYQFIARDGTKKWGEISGAPVIRDNKVVAITSVARDITERKQAEEAVRESENKFRNIFDLSSQAIALTEVETGKIVEVNKKFCELTQYSERELVGKTTTELGLYSDKDRTRFIDEVKASSRVHGLEMKFRAKDGSKLTALMFANLIEISERHLILTMFYDITEQKKLENQLRQSQKMESIGTLAGGIAHDFNNLLTTIIGNADLGLMDLGKGHPLREGIEDIKKAANSAASLTRQLLAFSRKQVIKPEVLDLNEVITATEKMLKRLMGEDVELSTVLEPEPWKVHVDRGQIEQVIMNLTVNARDAMPQGGQITIETANMDLDEDYFRKHGIEEQPDSYVMLSVSDTGIGMDKEIQSHIFEPFFTSKGLGKGTGLGLSTVYGIVKQNNGFIWVYSEPGQGSTFKIYLPRVKGDVKGEKKERTPVIKLAGFETVLIVEDDDSLRKLARTVLKQRGYKVLEAENGEDALRISKEHEGPIDLLITDVVMPRMGGKEVAERLQTLYPRMKVIYMSGYTDEAIVHHGVLVPGLNFLEKPFSPEGLARKVREVLDPALSKK
jgi:PAS domain S-box-containing protein